MKRQEASLPTGRLAAGAEQESSQTKQLSSSSSEISMDLAYALRNFPSHHTAFFYPHFLPLLLFFSFLFLFPAPLFARYLLGKEKGFNREIKNRRVSEARQDCIGKGLPYLTPYAYFIYFAASYAFGFICFCISFLLLSGFTLCTWT